MVIRISKLGGVGPHDGGNSLAPKRDVIAPGENRKYPFSSRDDLQACHRKLRRTGAAELQNELHRAGRLFIREQTKKIACGAKLNGQASWQPLRSGRAAGKPNHLENMHAFE